MYACLDTHYSENSARTALVLFDAWSAETPASSRVTTSATPAAYEPGKFYLRELPCLRNALSEAPELPDVVVIDGHAWLATERPGLGERLHQALDRRTPVIGVAKSAFHGNNAAVPVFRGASARPLYVSASGISSQTAADRIREMHGPHRLPTLLKLADTLARGGGPQTA